MDVVQTGDVGSAELADWVNAKLRRIIPGLASGTLPPEVDLDDAMIEARAVCVRAVRREVDVEGWIASETEGPRSATYRHLPGVLFTSEETAELRSIFGHAVTASGLPVGSFPSSRLERVFRGSA